MAAFDIDSSVDDSQHGCDEAVSDEPTSTSTIDGRYGVITRPSKAPGQIACIFSSEAEADEALTSLRQVHRGASLVYFPTKEQLRRWADLDEETGQWTVSAWVVGCHGDCDNGAIVIVGLGTTSLWRPLTPWFNSREKAQSALEVLRARFPSARIKRFDADYDSEDAPGRRDFIASLS